jgi:hypothetical protein
MRRVSLLLFGFFCKGSDGRYYKPHPDIGLHESDYVCSLDTKGQPRYALRYCLTF